MTELRGRQRYTRITRWPSAKLRRLRFRYDNWSNDRKTSKAKTKPQTKARKTGKRNGWIWNVVGPLLFILPILYLLNTSTEGDGGSAATKVVSSSPSVNKWWWAVLSVIAIMAIVQYVAVRYRRSYWEPESRRVAGGLLALVLINVIAYLFFTEQYTSVYTDGRFFWAILLSLFAIVFFLLLLGKPENLEKIDTGRMWAATIGVFLLAGVGWRVRAILNDDYRPKTIFYEVGGKSVEGPRFGRSPYLEITGADKDSVMAAFPGDTVMLNIAAIESGFRQFLDSARTVPLQNAEGTRAFGVFQILESHMRGLCRGFDVMKLEGNIQCAKNLRYNRPDYADWNASAWGWRDGYERKPADWTFEGGMITAPPRRTVEALVGPDESIVRADTIVLPPLGTEWEKSPKVLTDRKIVIVKTLGEEREYRFRAKVFAQNVVAEYVARNDTLHAVREDGSLVNTGGGTIPFYPQWLIYQSNDNLPLTLAVFYMKP